MNNTYIEEGMEYEPIEQETTSQKCPNKCGQLLVTWCEINGHDDYVTVYYCNQCEERFDE